MKITALMLTSMLTMMAGAIMAPGFPEITLYFADQPNRQILSRLIITLPALAIFFTSFLMGTLVDRIGRTPVLKWSLVLYFFAGTAGFYITDLYLLLVSRFLLGVAVSGVMTTVLTLIGDYFHGAERNRVMGIQGAFMGVGGIVFISASGFLADISWQTPFLLYAFSLPVLILGIKYLPEPSVHSSLTPQDDGVHKHKVNVPMLLMVLFSGFIGIVFFFMMPVQLPYLLKEIPDIPNWKIGIGIASSTMSATLVAVNLKPIRKIISNPQMYVVAFFFMAIGFFLVSRSSTYPQFVGSLLVAGLGTGLLMPAPGLWIVAIAPLKFRGRLVGLVSAFTFLGQFASPIIFQPMISAHSIRYAFQHAAVVLAILAVLYQLFHVVYIRKIAFRVERD